KIEHGRHQPGLAGRSGLAIGAAEEKGITEVRVDQFPTRLGCRVDNRPGRCQGLLKILSQWDPVGDLIDDDEEFTLIVLGIKVDFPGWIDKLNEEAVGTVAKGERW